MENSKIISFFKDENQQELKGLYNSIRPKFINWLKGNYNIVEMVDAQEIYQRSFTVLFLNAKKGKLDTIESTVETYLFGIGKYVIQEWRREKSDKLILVEDQSEMESGLEAFTRAFKSSKVEDSLVRKMNRALHIMGDPCQSILKLFYWEQNSMEAIANKTGYKNEAVARKKKYACLQKLKSILNES